MLAGKPDQLLNLTSSPMNISPNKKTAVVGSHLEIREIRRDKNENNAQINVALSEREQEIMRDKER